MATTPERTRPGQAVSARMLNENIVRGSQQAVKAGAGMEKRQAGRCFTLRAKDQQGLPQKAQRMRKAVIDAVNEDYLECTFYSERGAESLETVNVAKHISLRPSYYDGETFVYLNGDSITYTKDATAPEWKRQADDGSTSVDQIPIPCYRIGEQINVMQTETSVVVGGVNLVWEDMTPRVWAVI